MRFTLENKGFRIGILREGGRSNKDSPNTPQTRLQGTANGLKPKTWNPSASALPRADQREPTATPPVPHSSCGESVQ